MDKRARLLPCLLSGLLATSLLFTGGCSDDDDDFDRFREIETFSVVVAGGAGAGSTLAVSFQRDVGFDRLDTDGDDDLLDADLLAVEFEAISGDDLSFIDRIEVEAERQDFGASGREVIAKWVGTIPPGATFVDLELEERDIDDFIDLDDEEIELKISVFGVVPTNDTTLEGTIFVRFEVLN